MINLKNTVSLFIVLFLSGCGGGSTTNEVGSNIIFNEVRNIPEGNYLIVALPVSKYKAEISTSNKGVKVEWVGGLNCANSGEVKTYNDSCSMVQKGQIVITNPTTFGLGGDEIVTVKIIKI